MSNDCGWQASLQDVGTQQNPVFLAPAGSHQVLFSGEGGSVCAHVNQWVGRAEQNQPMTFKNFHREYCQWQCQCLGTTNSAVLGRADGTASAVLSPVLEHRTERERSEQVDLGWYLSLSSDWAACDGCHSRWSWASCSPWWWRWPQWAPRPAWPGCAASRWCWTTSSGVSRRRNSRGVQETLQKSSLIESPGVPSYFLNILC